MFNNIRKLVPNDDEVRFASSSCVVSLNPVLLILNLEKIAFLISSIDFASIGGKPSLLILTF